MPVARRTVILVIPIPNSGNRLCYQTLGFSVQEWTALRTKPAQPCGELNRFPEGEVGVVRLMSEQGVSESRPFGAHGFVDV